jgi:hypothetical protein
VLRGSGSSADIGFRACRCQAASLFHQSSAVSVQSPARLQSRGLYGKQLRWAFSGMANATLLIGSALTSLRRAWVVSDAPSLTQHAQVSATVAAVCQPQWKSRINSPVPCQK